MTTMTIVNVGYRSTNDWGGSAGRSRLLVDLGWPGIGIAGEILHTPGRLTTMLSCKRPFVDYAIIG